MISQIVAAADLGRGFACARGVDKSTSRGAGISATARMRNACAWFVAGRRRSGRPGGGRMKRPKSSIPRLSVRAVSVPLLCRNHPNLWKLRRRVVTQQKFFAPFLCDRPGCHEAPPKSGRTQARYCCSMCRQAVRRVRDRERKWHWRGTFRGRRLRAQEYQAARVRRCAKQPDTARATPPRPPP